MHDDCEVRQGVFAAKLEVVNGELVAALTGEHFGADDADVASAVTGSCAGQAMMDGESPVYLVRDSVVDVAVRSKRRMGDCGTEAFTRVVLGALSLPKSDLSSRLRNAVASVIGMTWVDAPWDGEMSEDDVEKVFDELGVETESRADSKDNQENEERN